MYSDSFKNLVKIASESSKSYYSDELHNKPNPYYVGFGNPNSKILIFGKEQGYNVNTDTADIMLYESINNPYEWKHYLDNNIIPHTDKFYNTALNYVNAFRPYKVKMGGAGHTYNKYHALTSYIYSDLQIEKKENTFFDHVFISEINYVPSKTSQIKTVGTTSRVDFIQNDFYKSFPIIICACGSYLSDDQIEAIFDLKLINDFSKSNERLKVFSDGKRVLINTRQLSMNIKNDYLKSIADIVKDYLN
jgi:hypothetical protein